MQTNRVSIHRSDGTILDDSVNLSSYSCTSNKEHLLNNHVHYQSHAAPSATMLPIALHHHHPLAASISQTHPFFINNLLNHLFLPPSLPSFHAQNHNLPMHYATTQHMTPNHIQFQPQPTTKDANMVIKSNAAHATNMCVDHKSIQIHSIVGNNCNKNNIKHENNTIEHESNHKIKFEASALEGASLDELLAKAMTFVPNLRWDVSDEWCRYCGARASSSFLRSPWGQKQLCFIHNKMWNENELNLSKFNEPNDIQNVVNCKANTERKYLMDILLKYDGNQTMNGRRWSLRKKRIKKEHNTKLKRDSSDDDCTSNESDSESMGSVYSMSSELQSEEEFDDEGFVKQEEEYMLKYETPYNMRIMENENEYLSQPMSSHNRLKIEATEKCTDGNNHNHNHNNNKVEKKRMRNKKKGAQKRRINWRKYYKYKRRTSLNPLECLLCDETFIAHIQFRRHMNKIHNVSRPYKCDICQHKEVRYANKAGLDMHFERDHEKRRDFKCKLCSKAFYRKAVLEKHQRVHDGLRPFVCTHCNTGFSQKTSLRQHIISIHLKQKNYKCNYCHKRFAALTTMKSHVVSMHNDVTYTRFQCDVCCKRFYEKGVYLKHKKNAHRPTDPIKEMIKRGQCIYEGCHKTYSSKNCVESVKYHLVAVHKDRKYANYECKQCQKLFYDKTRFKKHKTHHVNEHET